MRKDYDYINPSHYHRDNKECYQLMIEIWGKDAYIKFCEMNAYKYMFRLGFKPDQDIHHELAKARWYLNQANELKNDK